MRHIFCGKYIYIGTSLSISIYTIPTSKMWKNKRSKHNEHRTVYPHWWCIQLKHCMYWIYIVYLYTDSKFKHVLCLGCVILRTIQHNKRYKLYQRWEPTNRESTYPKTSATDRLVHLWTIKFIFQNRFIVQLPYFAACLRFRVNWWCCVKCWRQLWHCQSSLITIAVRCFTRRTIKKHKYKLIIARF